MQPCTFTRHELCTGGHCTSLPIPCLETWNRDWLARLGHVHVSSFIRRHEAWFIRDPYRYAKLVTRITPHQQPVAHLRHAPHRRSHYYQRLILRLIHTFTILHHDSDIHISSAASNIKTSNSIYVQYSYQASPSKRKRNGKPEGMLSHFDDGTFGRFGSILPLLLRQGIRRSVPHIIMFKKDATV